MVVLLAKPFPHLKGLLDAAILLLALEFLSDSRLLSEK
jgi:hypothetical protein